MESCQPIKVLNDKKKILSYRYDWEHCNGVAVGKIDAKTQKKILGLQ
jgi:hypothetical protein